MKCSIENDEESSIFKNWNNFSDNASSNFPDVEYSFKYLIKSTFVIFVLRLDFGKPMIRHSIFSFLFSDINF